MTVPVPDVEARLRALLSNAGQPGNCRGCAAPIRWVLHTNGKRTPYDADGPTAGVNHFVTCPQRDKFKRAL